MTTDTPQAFAIRRQKFLPCYHHILESTEEVDVELIWGGRDSGKSKFVSQLMSKDCLSLDYFRCILIKQTHESIKDAQWQMIKDNVEQWGWDLFFKFQLSPLSISCKSGGTFSARGMDNPGKVRSFSNPSHAWVEEGNQISEEAFITILTGLRSEFGKVKLIFTFNPESTEPDYREFWLYKMFFAKYEPLKNFTGQIEIKNPLTKQTETLTYRSTHTTYHDNRYVTGQRIAFHESLQLTNYYWYRVFTLGEWGNAENNSPWAFAFDRKKHVGRCTRNFSEPVYLSWDFNRNPMACNIIQHYGGRVYVLEVVKMVKAGIDAMCDYIKTAYPGALFIVTGDYSGTAESSLYKEQVTHYRLIQHYLSLSDTQIKVKPNPRLKDNSTLVNTILAFYPVTIDAEKGKPLIFDMENVKKAADGSIIKADRNDPAQQSDSLDGFRYWCNMFLDWFKPNTQNTSDKFVMEGLTCTREEYFGQVRSAMIKQAQQWVTDGELESAQRAASEIERLDKLFTVKA